MATTYDTLPAGYDDILEPGGVITSDDDAAMRSGCHYDYRSQEWVDGHDHAHCQSGDDSSPLLFCGADRETCRQGHPELWDFERRLDLHKA